MAKISTVMPGRPALLDGGAPLEQIWLVALAKTKAGNPKPPIEVRVSRRSDGWRGWPRIVKALDLRKRLQPMHWPVTDWREATPEEAAAFSATRTKAGAPSKAQRETERLIDDLNAANALATMSDGTEPSQHAAAKAAE